MCLSGVESTVGHKSNRKEGFRSTARNLLSAVVVFWAGGNNVSCYFPVDGGDSPKSLVL